MATTKNITMKQFNGTDYDTLYPKTIASQIPDVYSKTEVLTTETLSKYGLTANKLPNDVFQQIKTLIDNVQASADSKARIQTGSYVGTGTYGKNNPCSLTFDFVPEIICIYCFKDENNNLGVIGNSEYGSASSSQEQMSYTMVNTSIATTKYAKPGFGRWYSGQANQTYYSYWKCSNDRKTYYWYSVSHDGTFGNSTYQLNSTGYTYYYFGLS